MAFPGTCTRLTPASIGSHADAVERQVTRGHSAKAHRANSGR
jgi:hypothetical protein